MCLRLRVQARGFWWFETHRSDYHGDAADELDDQRSQPGFTNTRAVTLGRRDPGPTQHDAQPGEHDVSCLAARRTFDSRRHQLVIVTLSSPASVLMTCDQPEDTSTMCDPAALQSNLRSNTRVIPSGWATNPFSFVLCTQIQLG